MAQFVNDTFTETSQTALASHTADDSGTWTKHSSYSAGGYVVLAADRASCSTTSTAVFYHSGTPAGADYYVEAVLVCKTTTIGSSGGVCARVATGADDRYEFYYSQSSGAWILRKVVGGSGTTIQSSSATLTLDQSYTIKLEVVGTTITGYVGGTSTCSGTDSSITAAGKAGVRGSNSNADSTIGQQLDSIVAHDIVSSQEFSTSDSGTLSESIASVFAIAATDSGAFSESIGSVFAISATDSATLSETPDLFLGQQFSTSDSAVLSESIGFVLAIAASDSATLSESQGNVYAIAAADSATLTDSPAFVANTNAPTYAFATIGGVATQHDPRWTRISPL